MKAQSPINLTATVRATSLLPLRLNWCGTTGFLHRGEDGAQVIFPHPNGNTAILDAKQYVLRQFHFHHPSEHFLNGRQFDGELHVVHQHLSDCTFFVLAIFLFATEKVEMGNVANSFFDALLDRQHVDIPTDPKEWLPDGVDKALRYEGSLTTPPFSETVTWVVFHEPLLISQKQFGAIFGDGSAQGPSHSKPQKARPLQPVNRRYIIEYKVLW